MEGTGSTFMLQLFPFYTETFLFPVCMHYLFIYNRHIESGLMRWNCTEIRNVEHSVEWSLACQHDDIPAQQNDTVVQRENLRQKFETSQKRNA